MPTFKKKYFKEQIIKNKKEIDEFVDSDGGIIDGDRNTTSDSEIETGPVQKPFNDTTDYEKGVSTTTDRATRYRQDIPWFATYSTGGAVHRVTESRVVTKGSIDEMIESLVKKGKDVDIIDKNSNNKLQKVLDIIEDSEFDDNNKALIKKALDSIKNDNK
jgi:hypothetical protein